MKRLLCVLVLVIFPFLSAWAVKVSTLYQAQLPVLAQSETIKPDQARQGLLEVLIKVTGDAQLGLNPLVSSMLEKAEDYVEETSYLPPSTSKAYPYFLQIQYDSQAINRNLKSAGLSYWSENRPLILTWLTVKTPTKAAEIIGDDAQNEIQVKLKQSANQYGLPLILPALDMADITHISANDILSSSLPLLKETSKRYSPDAILIGNMGMNGDGVESQWKLVLDDQQWDFRFSDTSTEKVMTTLMENIMQTLAKHYSTKEVDSKSDWVNLEINHVKERSDVKNIMKYLKQLTSVQQVELSQVTEDTLMMRVLINGPMDSFKSNARLGEHLLLKPEESTDNKLVYEWNH